MGVVRQSNEKFYTPADVAKLFGISMPTTYKRIGDGTFPSIRLGQKIYVYRDAIDRMLAGPDDREELVAKLREVIGS